MNRKLIAAAAVVVIAVCVLTACSESMPSIPDDGISVSGIVLFDGDPLPGVTIVKNGESAGVTDSNGVFSLSGLERGDIVAFSLDGYTFSPSSHTVAGTVNDLTVLAHKDDLSEGGGNDPNSPDVPEEPEEPDLPDVPEPPEEPDVPEEPEPVTLSSPTAFFAVYTEGGIPAIGFSADARTEKFSLRVTLPSGEMLSSAAAKDGVFSFDGFEIPFKVTVTEDSLLVTLDVSAPVGMYGVFSVAVTSSAEGAEDGVSETFSSPFAQGAPEITGLNFADSILSWDAVRLPGGCTFAVLANGVRIAETPSCSADLSSLSLAAGTSLRAAALIDGKIVALSDELVLS